MEVLSEGSERVPQIVFNGDELSISGRSYMNNALVFYKGIISSIERMVINKLIVDVNLEYFNTSSSKCLLELFRLLERKYNEGADIRIKWEYQTQYLEMNEAGEDYRDLLRNIPFEIIEQHGEN